MQSGRAEESSSYLTPFVIANLKEICIMKAVEFTQKMIKFWDAKEGRNIVFSRLNERQKLSSLVFV